MGFRKKQKRRHRLIAFKVFEDTDPDILDWWDSIENGERSNVIRDVLREYLGLPAHHRKHLIMPEISNMHRDILWIHDALNDMPDFLERVMQQLAEIRPNTPPTSRPLPDDLSPSESTLTNAESQRRAKHLKKATW